MRKPFTQPSRAEILAVGCPACGAVSGEACRRDDGKSHAPRLTKARAVLTRQRTRQRDAPVCSPKTDAKEKHNDA
jgi:hypothetical protein